MSRAYLLNTIILYLFVMALSGGAIEGWSALILTLIITVAGWFLGGTKFIEAHIVKKEMLRPVTLREKPYVEAGLLPVINRAGISLENLNVMIIDSPLANALAIGSRTIAVTTGMIQEGVNQGVIAHELGHLALGHTQKLLRHRTATFLYSAMSEIFEKLQRIPLIGLIFIIILHQDAFSLGAMSQRLELEADQFAVQIGFGAQLSDFLDAHKNLAQQPKTLIEKRMMSHPITPERIDRIDRAVNNLSA